MLHAEQFLYWGNHQPRALRTPEYCWEEDNQIRTRGSRRPIANRRLVVAGYLVRCPPRSALDDDKATTNHQLLG